MSSRDINKLLEDLMSYEDGDQDYTELDDDDVPDRVQDIVHYLMDHYKNVLVAVSNERIANGRVVDDGDNTTIMSCQFKGVDDDDEDGLDAFTMSWLSAFMEQLYKARGRRRSWQGLYDFFSRLAGYYYFLHPKDVEDTYGIMGGIDVDAVKSFMRRKQKRHNTQAKEKLSAMLDEMSDNSVQVADSRDFTESQAQSLLDIFSASSTDIDAYEDEDGKGEIVFGSVNLKNLTPSQKEAFAEILDIDLDDLKKEVGKKVNRKKTKRPNKKQGEEEGEDK